MVPKKKGRAISVLTVLQLHSAVNATVFVDTKNRHLLGHANNVGRSLEKGATESLLVTLN